MKEKKANLDLTYQALSKKKEELIKKAKELNEKCNSKKMEIIKFSLAQKEQYKIENLEIDKLISLCEDVNFKVTDMKEKYVSFTDELKQKVSSTENEKKEIQQNLLNLQNELRQIEDLISSSSINLSLILLSGLLTGSLFTISNVFILLFSLFSFFSLLLVNRE